MKLPSSKFPDTILAASASAKISRKDFFYRKSMFSKRDTTARVGTILSILEGMLA